MICVVFTLQFISLLHVFVSAVLKFVRGEDPIGLEIQRWGALVAIEGSVRYFLEVVVIVLVKHVAGRFVCSKLGLHRWYVLRVG